MTGEDICMFYMHRSCCSLTFPSLHTEFLDSLFMILLWI